MFKKSFFTVIISLLSVFLAYATILIIWMDMAVVILSGRSTMSPRIMAESI